MQTRALVAAAVALALPAGALAATPPHQGKPAKAEHAAKAEHGAKAKHVPTVMYVVRGTVAAYTAATDTASGSVTVTVTGANHHGKALKDATQPVVFVLGATTRIVLHKGADVAVGDRVVVKVRAAKAFDATAFAATAARQLVDQGPPSTSTTTDTTAGSGD